MRSRLIFPAALVLLIVQCAAVHGKEMLFRGTCDASAACVVDAETFVVGDDENNILRLYSLAEPGMPIAEFPMGRFLKTNVDKHPESDIEACAKVGDRIYWIASHGRSKSGKWRANRYLFFATRIVSEEGKPVRIEPDGRPCRGMLEALLGLPGLDLRRSVGKVGANAAGSLAPKDAGLNIEGLSVAADGKTLYLGLRNPRPEGRALLLPLTNAAAVVEQGAAPEFGEASKLDFGGRGVRSIEYSSAHGRYFIAAGSHDNERISALYSWAGRPDAKPRQLRAFDAFNPEAIALVPGTKRLLVLSDDGSKMVKVAAEGALEPLDKNGQCPCKSLKDPRMKSFRALTVEID